jgi:hypothetical protein
MNSDQSNLEQLILNNNPFDRSLVVRSHDIWEQHFPDVATINATVSNAILQGISQVKQGQRDVLGIAIKAEKGLGKSHLLSRIRSQVKSNGDSFFIYANEPDYDELDDINQRFLNTVALSMKQIGNHGVTQWQELAALMVQEALLLAARPVTMSIPDIVQRFAQKESVQLNETRVGNFTQQMCKIKPHIEDPDVVRAIFWTLCPEKAPFAVNWLSGKELSAKQAEVMNLPASREKKLNARSLDVIMQTLNLLGEYRVIIICFDELEPKSCNRQGLSTPQVVALLAKDLYSRLKRCVIITACFPVTWRDHLLAMPRAESVVDRIGEKQFDLKPLNGDDVLSLISCWLQNFYTGFDVQPPTPYYPFQEDQLRSFGKEKPVVRKVLNWCAENWPESFEVVKPSASVDPIRKVKVAYQEQMTVLATQESDNLNDSDRIAAALELAFTSLVGQTIEEVTIKKIQLIPTKADQKYLNFKIVGVDRGTPVKIGVAVRQESGGSFMTAAMKRLTNYTKFGFTRGCLVRSKKLNPKTDGEKLLNQMLAEQGGEWVVLKFSEVQSLLAISLVYESCDEYEVSQEEVITFMQQQELAINNMLIREILSDPSGQTSLEVIDEDITLESSTIVPNQENLDLETLI